MSHRSRYLFSPRISGFIYDAEATLSLAMCCIMYLCQGHHDPESLDANISYNIISGAYRFHDFSETVWLELVERFACLSQSQTPPDELISLLEMLMRERSNDQCNSTTEQSAQPNLKSFESNWPQLHSMLFKVARFRQICSKTEYNKRQGK